MTLRAGNCKDSDTIYCKPQQCRFRRLEMLSRRKLKSLGCTDCLPDVMSNISGYQIGQQLLDTWNIRRFSRLGCFSMFLPIFMRGTMSHNNEPSHDIPELKTSSPTWITMDYHGSSRTPLRPSSSMSCTCDSFASFEAHHDHVQRPWQNDFKFLGLALGLAISRHLSPWHFSLGRCLNAMRAACQWMTRQEVSGWEQCLDFLLALTHFFSHAKNILRFVVYHFGVVVL